MVGKGTYGEVYKVRRNLDQRIYAIKKIIFSVFDENSINKHKISREIESLKSLHHKNIVRYQHYSELNAYLSLGIIPAGLKSWKQKIS